MVAWGDVPTWVGSVITGSAAAFASFTYFKDRRDNRWRDARGVRLGVRYVIGEPSERVLQIPLHNYASRPLYGVTVEAWRGSESLGSQDTEDPCPPGYSETFTWEVGEFDPPKDFPTIRYAVEFTDADGRLWRLWAPDLLRPISAKESWYTRPPERRFGLFYRYPAEAIDEAQEWLAALGFSVQPAGRRRRLGRSRRPR